MAVFYPFVYRFFRPLNGYPLVYVFPNQVTIVIVVDQTLHAKAAEIARKQDQFSNIVLRIGTFHMICIALAILGKRFGDSRLKDIFIESQIVAEGSISGVIDGKHYNRGLRAHKYLYEAMMRLG